MRRLCLRGGSKKTLSMEDGDSMTDVFEGVEFTWASVAGQSSKSKHGNGNGYGSLQLSFEAEHTDMALERYVPFITATVAEARRKDRALQIFMNEGSSWHGITHHHPSTFDTLAMDPALKQSIVADLDRFLGRRDYYRRIGKAWKRGYLLYGPKSSLVAAMANHLRFNLYDLDLSEVRYNIALQRLLTGMPNKSILVIEDIDCCFSTKSRKEEDDLSDQSHLRSSTRSQVSCIGSRNPDYCRFSRKRKTNRIANTGNRSAAQPGITLSGLLNFIDGLWSTSGEERINVFTTNYKTTRSALKRYSTALDHEYRVKNCCTEYLKRYSIFSLTLYLE
jgi:chaperone BCS1